MDKHHHTEPFSTFKLRKDNLKLKRLTKQRKQKEVEKNQVFF